MSVFARRFTYDPGVDVLLNIESVNILDLTPPAETVGVGSGAVLVVGEFENGPYNTPTEVIGSSDFFTTFGGVGFTYGQTTANWPCSPARKADGLLGKGEPWNGNGAVQLNGLQFARLFITRVNTSPGSVQFYPLAYLTGYSQFSYNFSAAAPIVATITAGGTGTFTVANGATFPLSGSSLSVTGFTQASGTWTRSANVFTFAVGSYGAAQTLVAGQTISYAGGPWILGLKNDASSPAYASFTAIPATYTPSAVDTVAEADAVQRGQFLTFQTDNMTTPATAYFQAGLTGTLAQALLSASNVINSAAGFPITAVNYAGTKLVWTAYTLGNNSTITFLADDVSTANPTATQTATIYGGSTTVAASPAPAAGTFSVTSATGLNPAGGAHMVVNGVDLGPWTISGTAVTLTTSVVVAVAAQTVVAGGALFLLGILPQGTVLSSLVNTASASLVNSSVGSPGNSVATWRNAQFSELAAVVNAEPGFKLVLDQNNALRISNTATPSTGLIQAVAPVGGQDLCPILGFGAGTTASPYALTNLTTPGTLPTQGKIPAGTLVHPSGGSTLQYVVTAQDINFTSTGVIVDPYGTNVTQPATGPYTVPVRHALDDGSGIGINAGAVDTILLPPTVFSFQVQNTQAISAAPTENQIDVAYENALTSTLDLSSVASQTNVIVSARQSNAIRRALLANVLFASANGMLGRVACIRPPLGTTELVATSPSAEPGVGAYSSQRVFYCWPQQRTQVPAIQAVGLAGNTQFLASTQGVPPTPFTATGVVDTGADFLLASVCSQLPPEENPGQETSFTTYTLGLESSSNAQGLVIQDYINLKTNGIVGLRMDGGVAIFQSGVTSVNPSLYPSLVRISRRRMADYIEDTMSIICKQYGKKLQTAQRQTAVRVSLVSFLDGLLSRGNPSSQRIAGYTLSAPANATALASQGLFRLTVKVQTLSSFDSIVLESTVGDQVTVTEVAATVAS